jgi:hypothetical protein
MEFIVAGRNLRASSVIRSIFKAIPARPALCGAAAFSAGIHTVRTPRHVGALAYMRHASRMAQLLARYTALKNGTMWIGYVISPSQLLGR